MVELGENLDHRLLTECRDGESLKALLPDFLHGPLRTQSSEKFIDLGTDPEELVGEGVLENNPALTPEELTAGSDGRSQGQSL
jgi:hypothetical protein